MDDSHSDAVKGAFAMQAMGTLDVDEAASMLMPMVGKAGAAMKAAAGVKSNSTALVPAGGNGESGGGSDVRHQSASEGSNRVINSRLFKLVSE